MAQRVIPNFQHGCHAVLQALKFDLLITLLSHLESKNRKLFIIPKKKALWSTRS